MLDTGGIFMLQTGSMSDYDLLIRKLASIAVLSESEQDALRALPMAVRVVKADEDIVREHDRPHQSCLMLEGFAQRYKSLANGTRQIMAFHMAGDFMDLHGLHLGVMDHSIGSITTGRVGFVSHAALYGLMEKYPAIAGAFWRDTLVDAAIFREWIVNVGRRNAFERISHLFCELFVRAQAVGLARADSCKLPLTQAEIADATGITVVHVNRTLRELRAEGLIALERRTLTILDWNALRDAAGFDPGYLHLIKAA